MMFIVMFTMNAWLALMSLLPIILGFACEASMLVGQKAKPAIKARVDAAEEINASSIEYVRGMPSIKIFGQTVRSFQNYHGVILKFRDAAVHMAAMIRPGYVWFVEQGGHEELLSRNGLYNKMWRIQEQMSG